MKERYYNKYFEWPYVLALLATIYIYEHVFPLILGWMKYTKSESLFISIVQIPVGFIFAALLIGISLIVNVFIFKALYSIGKKMVQILRDYFSVGATAIHL